MKKTNLFLSYSWKNQQEADVIDNDFRSLGLNIIRDVRSMAYKESIRSFMDSITASDFAVILISPDFLRSESCMYEIREIFKDIDYSSKILPVILPSHDFLKPQNRLSYINYWEQRIVELNDKIKNVEYLVKIESVSAELNHFHSIRSSIDETMRLFYDMNCFTFDQLKKINYKPIFDSIGFSKEKIREELLVINELSDFEEQETKIRKLLYEYPNNEEVLYLQMNIAFEQGDYVLAGERCEYFLNLYPNSAPAHNSYSLVLKRVRAEYLMAKEHSERAIELDPIQPVYWVNLGNLYIEDLNNINEAERCYKKTIELNPAYYNAYESLGYLYEFETKDLEKAETFYLKALEINPSKEIIYHRLSNFYARIDKVDKAIEFYIKLLSINPLSDKGHFNYGKFLQDQKRDYSKARVHYEKALEINPFYAKAHYNYSLLLLFNYHEFDKAEKHLKIAGMYDEEFRQTSFKSHIELLKSIAGQSKILLDNDYNKSALSPEFPITLMKLVQAILKEPTDWFEVKNILHEILEIHPKYDLAQHLLITILRDIFNDYDEAFKHFLQLLENNQDNANMHHEAALIYHRHYKNYEKAILHLKQSVLLNPQNANTQFELSALYLTKTFEPDLAKKHYLAAGKLDKKYIMEELDDIFQIKRF